MESIESVRTISHGLLSVGMAGIRNENAKVEGLKAALDIVDDRISLNQDLMGDEAGWRRERVRELEEVRRQLVCLIADWTGGAWQMVATFEGVEQKLRNALLSVGAYKSMAREGVPIPLDDMVLAIGELTLAMDSLNDLLYQAVMDQKGAEE